MRKASPINPVILPLSWPTGVHRHDRRNIGSSRFHTRDMATGVLGAFADLETHTGKKIEEIAITVGDADLALAGDPGAAAYFRWEDETYCFAVDRYLDISSNLQAIKQMIDHRVSEAKFVSVIVVRASLVGFRAMTETFAKAQWRSLLGFRPDEMPSVDQLRKAYRKRRSGGGVAVDAAFDAALKEIGKE